MSSCRLWKIEFTFDVKDGESDYYGKCPVLYSKTKSLGGFVFPCPILISFHFRFPFFIIKHSLLVLFALSIAFHTVLLSICLVPKFCGVVFCYCKYLLAGTFLFRALSLRVQSIAHFTNFHSLADGIHLLWWKSILQVLPNRKDLLGPYMYSTLFPTEMIWKGLLLMNAGKYSNLANTKGLYISFYFLFANEVRDLKSVDVTLWIEAFISMSSLCDIHPSPSIHFVIDLSSFSSVEPRSLSGLRPW